MASDSLEMSIKQLHEISSCACTNDGGVHLLDKIGKQRNRIMQALGHPTEEST